MTPTLEAFLEAMGMELAPQINAGTQDQDGIGEIPTFGSVTQVSLPASAAPFLPAEAVSELCL